MCISVLYRIRSREPVFETVGQESGHVFIRAFPQHWSDQKGNVGWLVGWLVGRSVGWLIGGLVDCLFGLLVVWLFGWLVC